MKRNLKINTLHAYKHPPQINTRKLVTISTIDCAIQLVVSITQKKTPTTNKTKLIMHQLVALSTTEGEDFFLFAEFNRNIKTIKKHLILAGMHLTCSGLKSTQVN